MIRRRIMRTQWRRCSRRDGGNRLRPGGESRRLLGLAVAGGLVAAQLITLQRTRQLHGRAGQHAARRFELSRYSERNRQGYPLRPDSGLRRD
jgi:hypothetical protein